MNKLIVLCVHFAKLFLFIEVVFLIGLLEKNQTPGFPKNEPQEFCDSPKNNNTKMCVKSAYIQKYIFL